MTAWLKKQLGHDASPIVQFIKYGIAGGAATATHIIVFFLMGWFVFPCLTQDDVIVRLFHLTVQPVAGADETVRLFGGWVLTQRALYALYCSTVGFVVANVLCYFLNRLFVFKPGRHHWLVEFLLFFAVSGLSVVIGSAVQTLLITKFDVQTSISFAANIFSSLLINYAARKFFIFKH